MPFSGRAALVTGASRGPGPTLPVNGGTHIF